MKPIHFLGVLFVITLYFAYKVYYSFLETMIIAILLAIATSKINNYFLARYSKLTSATLTTLVLAILFFSPIIYFITSIAANATHIEEGTIVKLTEAVKIWVNEFSANLGFVKPYIEKITTSFDTGAVFEKIVAVATYIGAKSAKFLKDSILILVFYFFANLYGREIFEFLKNILPLRKDESMKLFDNLSGVMGVVFYSILATAIFEGVLFAIIAYIYGYDPLLFGIMYGFASLIPVIGGALMWVPLALHQYAMGNATGAIVIALYSLIVISLIADTFIKPVIIKYIDQIVIKKELKINELLIFFSIVAGLSSFGFWGMIIGPAVTSLLISILNIYPEISKNGQDDTTL
ncbi:AI-2E family transporter [Nitrosophilus alvini]|uniref:AI-2E family transporter n=1 Tax=Nitrosophilus alvini TaxID=2714855 RepID=UPI001F2F399B|nr:AI-2E family transporter [Nitrosophilus alvini]